MLDNVNDLGKKSPANLKDERETEAKRKAEAKEDIAELIRANRQLERRQ